MTFVEQATKDQFGLKVKMLYIQAGAGVVADSQPALEWKETMNKARAMFKAVSMVNGSEGRK